MGGVILSEVIKAGAPEAQIDRRLIFYRNPSHMSERHLLITAMGCELSPGYWRRQIGRS